jgi:hypothetical protein
VKTTRFEPSPCTSCGKRLDAASHLDGKSVPVPGDATVCIECGHVMVFGENMRLRDPTPQEETGLVGDPVLIKTGTLVAAFRRWRANDNGD